MTGSGAILRGLYSNGLRTGVDMGLGGGGGGTDLGGRGVCIRCSCGYPRGGLGGGGRAYGVPGYRAGGGLRGGGGVLVGGTYNC